MKVLVSLILGGALVGCGAGLPQSSAPAYSNGAASRSMSWMLPQAKGGKSVLLYVSDSADNEILVYDYSSLKQVGSLSSIYPSAQCVDATGDVYIRESNNYFVEYAHGGTKVLKTFSPAGSSVGCSVDAKGDVAITSYSPGYVSIFARGNPEMPKTYSDPDCAYQWTMGYDAAGNLIGVGETTAIDVCALLAGAESETTLSTSGIAITFPNGTMWDGKYIALGDQEAAGKFHTGLVEASLSGSALTSKGEAVLTDRCYGSDEDAVNPFVVGTKNTPVNEKQGTVVVGGNSWCQASSQHLGFWHYPKGGNPFKTLKLDYEPAGWSVSIGT